MISIKRIESGKITYTDFHHNVDLLSEGWNLHPDLSRFYTDLTAGELHLLHGEAPAYLLRDLPEYAVLEMRNLYNPTDVYDTGGFVAYSTDEHKLELYEYYNDLIGPVPTFPYVRMVRSGADYEGYGSQDGVNWDIRGAINFPDARLWGLALEGSSGDPLKVQTIAVYKGTKLRFRALPLGGRVEVYDTRTDTPALIDQVTAKTYEAEVSVFDYTMPLSVNVKIYDKAGELVAEDNHLDVFGGDVFHCGNFLEVYYNDEPLEVFDNDFGYLDDFFKDYRLELRNMIDVPHTNANIEIKQYVNMDGQEEFGWEWVQICKDVDGAPDGAFSKTIQIEEVPASGGAYFWVRIMRNSIPVKVDDYLMDFVINVW